MPFSANELLAALPRLRRYARVLTGDPACADDVVEETIALARTTQDVNSFGTSPRMQLFALLRSIASTRISPSGQYEAPPQANIRKPIPDANGYPNQGKSQTQADQGQELLAQLLRLPIEQREILVLVGAEGMSYDEIATLLHVPVATVISRLSQARNELRSKTFGPLAAPKSAR